ncbi:hypothetical protein [Aeoliella mucimassa]|uniref:IPTL-CTERM protein sorting domain-containing protein n=1 Tax=Aeoliella mucimassa TaxID=2527972 RepID=A0A518AK55_9BACT|nr:hypothetical protein [Aeoliella mucimassa]QDU55066.1 hypothetical protein Pan181_12520 [Aeoliella mucimassa]
MPSTRSLLFLVCVFATPAPVFAAFGITSTTNATVIDAPASVAPGALKTSTPVVFQEVSNGVLSYDLATNHDGSSVVAAPTIINSGGSLIANPALVPSVIESGTAFNSYMVHFDPTCYPFYVCTIEFETDIIGVQLFSDGLGLASIDGTLEEGDAAVTELGSTTEYPTGVSERGVEADLFMIATEGNKLLLAGIGFDQIRVFTAGYDAVIGPQGVPELTTVVGWTILAGLGLVAYRRNANK